VAVTSADMINDRQPPSSRGTSEVKESVYGEWLRHHHVGYNSHPHFETRRSRLSPPCPSQFPRYPKKPNHSKKVSATSCSAAAVAPLEGHKSNLPSNKSRFDCSAFGEHIRPGMSKVKWIVTQAHVLPEIYGFAADQWLLWQNPT
jgi:hypothetical protein